jgi:hypothetical protein
MFSYLPGFISTRIDI